MVYNQKTKKGGGSMFLLEGFTAFNFNEGVPYVSVTNNGVTFNKAVVMKLGYPAHVVLLINDNTKQIALLPCDESVENATTFYKEKESKVISVRWNGKDLLNTLQAMMGWDLKRESYKIDGVLLKNENAMLFDFTKASELK